MADDDVQDSSIQKLKKAWSNVLLTECIVIAIINTFTVAAFVRNRHLRKRTTYLIINLTVTDLLVGAVTGPVEIFGPVHDLGNDFNWKQFIISTSSLIFSLASLVNLSLISLERLHATLFPFRHCLIEKWLYFKVIIGSWMITLFLASIMSVLQEFNLVLILYSFGCYIFLTLLTITASYAIIIIKVRSNPLPQHFGAVASERKLTITLSKVTVVSILTILPLSIWMTLSQYILNHMSHAAFLQLNATVSLLYYANSIVNPLIYAIRMHEFRKAVKELSCKRTEVTRAVQDIELQAM